MTSEEICALFQRAIKNDAHRLETDPDYRRRLEAQEAQVATLLGGVAYRERQAAAKEYARGIRY